MFSLSRAQKMNPTRFLIFLLLFAALGLCSAWAEGDVAPGISGELRWGALPTSVTCYFTSQEIKPTQQPFPGEPQAWKKKTVMRFRLECPDFLTSTNTQAASHPRTIAALWNQDDAQLILDTNQDGDLSNDPIWHGDKYEETYNSFKEVALPLQWGDVSLDGKFHLSISRRDSYRVEFLMRRGWVGELRCGKQILPLCISLTQRNGEPGFRMIFRWPAEKMDPRIEDMPERILMRDTFYRMEYKAALRDGKPILTITGAAEKTPGLGTLQVDEKVVPDLVLKRENDPSGSTLLLPESPGGAIALPEGRYNLRFFREGFTSNTVRLQSREPATIDIKAGETLKRDYGVGLKGKVTTRLDYGVLYTDYETKDKAGLPYFLNRETGPSRVKIMQNGKVLHEAAFEYG